MPDRAELDAWVRLLLSPGLGRGAARRVLSAFGSPEVAVSAPRSALAAVVGPAAANALATPAPEIDRHCESLAAWVAGGPRREVVALGDPRYPPRLLQTPDPPLVLFVLGDATLLAEPSIAIVGSRHPSAQGSDNARRFARELSQRGLLVVSGLALGIDGAAHEGALSLPAPTLAVVGTGLDRVYPARHHDLAHRIAEHGALVSEFLPGTPPLRENFPQRNRVIAGLTLGTLVVEAAPRSGSLITARLAGEYGREVFAVPGSIHAVQARGCHALIREGAKLVESADDVLEEVDRPASPLRAPAPAATTPPQGEDDPVLDALGHDPTNLDTLLARTGLPTPELLGRLLELELDGRVARLPGGLYQRREIS